VTALYAEHALGLTRLAQVMLGDRAAAEDVVHDAFFGIYRRWACRTALRQDARRNARQDTREPVPPAPTADAAVFSSDDRQALMAGLRRLPHRQREALVLRYYMDLSDAEIASSMGIRESTVRSTVHRGLAALERILTWEAS
jgi:RNA polymerase sigma factor (sigma-70 family)